MLESELEFSSRLQPKLRCNPTIRQKLRLTEKQARDLEGQMGETNRDVMSLGFRVDTHSTQFRPLPVTEELRSLKYADEAVNGLDIDDGVLPPRAEPVFLLPEESSTQ